MLLDPSNISRMAEIFQRGNQRLEPLRTKEIRGLDTQMQEIVNDQSLSEREKVLRYNSTLTEFQNLSKEKTVAFREPTKKVNIPTVSDDNTYDELAGVPKIYHSKAKTLLKILKPQDLQISKNGEVTIGKEKISGSNISDFLNKTVNPNARSHSPAGWTRFQSLLKDSNVPQMLMSKKVQKELANTPGLPLPKKAKARSPRKSKADPKWESY